jgi:hypothetical protein
MAFILFKLSIWQFLSSCSFLMTLSISQIFLWDQYLGFFLCFTYAYLAIFSFFGGAGA